MARDELTALDRLRQLDEERSRILEQAKGEALEAAQGSVQMLNSLGFNYQLVEGGKRVVRAEPVAARARRTSSDRPCPICGFRTNPPHDARAHRGQAVKAVFTAQELSDKGLERIPG